MLIGGGHASQGGDLMESPKPPLSTRAWAAGGSPSRIIGASVAGVMMSDLSIVLRGLGFDLISL